MIIYTGKFKTLDGPIKNIASDTIKKADNVTYLLGILEHKNPTNGDAKA